MNTQVPKVELFSVPISITSQSEVLAIITEWVTEWKSTRGTKGIKSTKGKFPGEEIPTMQASDTSNTSNTSGTSGTSGTFPKIITTPNPEMIVAAQKDPEFLKALQSADLAIPDGVGVVAAVRLLKAKGQGLKAKGRERGEFFSSLSPHPLALIPSRVSGISLMENLIALAAKNDWRVMLVGGKEGVAEKAAAKCRELWVMSSGSGSEGRKRSRSQNFSPHNSQLFSQPITHNSSFGISALSAPPDITHASPHDLDHLITSINKIKPDLLFVAFGHGKQEKWMARYRNRLDVGVMMGVGGALDQIVDPTLRPPATIDSMGLGWLYRLVREPWRARRQLALLKFTAMVIRVFVRSI